DGFKIGRARLLQKGRDITIIACGIMVKFALDAAEALEKEGKSVRVVNMHTIRPLDKKAIIESAKLTKRIVTCEEHLISGGLGSAVAEVLAENLPTPMVRIGIRGKFGQSGSPEELIKEYHLTPDDIVQACHKLLNR
ncbi:MAG: transketolase family protein, partial [Omnitrophica bacterium]|nr:transketolase family protein [Candidatus Omnitrophota bacterium]